MREIKFRGRRTDNGEWVYGDLVHTGTDAIAILESGAPCLEAVTDVVPESVGQFTGLYDKNGKEVYERDIVEIDGAIKGIVRYNARHCRYEMATVCEPLENERIPLGRSIDDWEVIGNIHANPKLLKTE